MAFQKLPSITATWCTTASVHSMSPYPSQAVADRACKDEAQQRATDPLEIKWAFQWPSQEAFDAGQRYGLCWVPDKA